MSAKASSLLTRLERSKADFGQGSGSAKLALLQGLDRFRLATAEEVIRLHEVLCFLRAYPDDRPVLEQATRMLDDFEQRSDLRRHREELVDSGLAGTDIFYSFYWPTARWLARRWPQHLLVDWEDFESAERVPAMLHLMVPFGATPALDTLDLATREWIDRLRASEETDATFLVRRFEALEADSFTRESLYESLDIPMRIAPGPGTPARGRAFFPHGRTVFQRTPLPTDRPDLRVEVRKPPVAVRRVSPSTGSELIDLARGAMVSRSRDLDAFAYGDPDDVRIVDCGDGLKFVCIGQIPERRLMFESVYGYLTLKNGVPMGYVLSSALFESAEIAYNVFDTYRGAEAAQVFARVLAMVHHLFGARTFSIDPYQLGYGNAEGLASGAWWFYYKLGFRPADPEIQALADGETVKIASDRRHRSSADVLEELASDYLFLHLGRPRRHTLGSLDLSAVGVKIAAYVAERFGGDRRAAAEQCGKEAARLLGVRQRGMSAGERLAWGRWAPLVLLLGGGVSRWSPSDRRDLAAIARAKGGRSESDFARLFDAHPKLRRALLRLAEADGS